MGTFEVRKGWEYLEKEKEKEEKEGCSKYT